MENESLHSAIAIAVALVFSAIWIRRRFGSFRDIWAAQVVSRLNFQAGDVLKALFMATGVLWLAVWLFTTSEQRAEMKQYFIENSPWASWTQDTQAPDTPK